MEAGVIVSCHCIDKAQRDLFYQFLHEQTRPVLEDDVEPDQVELFEALDNLDSPEYMKKHNDVILHMSWFIGGDDVWEEGELIINDLVCAGAYDVYMALSMDGGICSLMDSQGPIKSPFDKKRFKAIQYNDDFEPLFAFLDAQQAYDRGILKKFERDMQQPLDES